MQRVKAWSNQSTVENRRKLLKKKKEDPKTRIFHAKSEIPMINKGLSTRKLSPFLHVSAFPDLLQHRKSFKKFWPRNWRNLEAGAERESRLTPRGVRVDAVVKMLQLLGGSPGGPPRETEVRRWRRRSCLWGRRTVLVIRRFSHPSLPLLVPAALSHLGFLRPQNRVWVLFLDFSINQLY